MTRVFAIFLLVLTVATPLRAQDLVVFAAASLKGPLDQIAADFGGVTVSYGGSGTLARQVGFGAPADVVLLANAAWIDDLVTRGDVRAETVADFVSNTLVLVGQPNAVPLDLTPVSLRSALGDGRLAIGNTLSVPAGIYGRAALTELGLWETVAPQLAEMDSVRAALALVERGEVPLGLVYNSDTLVTPDLTVVARFPTTSHPPIRYIGAVATASTHPQAQAFLDSLQTPTVQALFKEAGFCITRPAC